MCYYPDPLDSYIIFAVTGANTFFALCCIGMIVVGALIPSALSPYSNSLTEIMFPILEADSSVMLALGIIGLLLAFTLYFTLCCPSKELFVAMAVFMFLYMLTDFILIIMYAALYSTLQSQMETQWQTNLATYFKDPANSASLTSTTSYDYYWNNLMYTLQCCGAISYTDYQNATQWSRTYGYTLNNQYYSVSSATIPIWCCTMQTTTFAIQNPTSWTCVTSPSTSNSNYQTTCENALYAAVHKTDFLNASIAFSVIALVLLIIIIPALILAIQHEKWNLPETMRNPKPPLMSGRMNNTVKPMPGLPPNYIDRTKPTVASLSYDENIMIRRWNPDAPIVNTGAPVRTAYNPAIKEQMAVVNVM